MPRLNIACLPDPPERYRPDHIPPPRSKKPFESIQAVQQEEAKRHSGLSLALKRHLRNPGNIRATRLLMAKLDGSGDYPSMASPVYMREQRKRIGGHLYKLIVETGAEDSVVAFTLILKNRRLRPRELNAFDVVKELAAVRSALNREGARDASGWLIMFMHADFNEVTKRWEFHVHGIADGEMVGVIQRLSDRRKFQSDRGDPDGVWTPLMIHGPPLTDLPWPLTYIIKSYLPGISTYRSKTGHRNRTRHRKISQPYYTQALLWMDRWRLKDICLMMGLRVTREGLTPTKRQTCVHE